MKALKEAIQGGQLVVHPGKAEFLKLDGEFAYLEMDYRLFIGEHGGDYCSEGNRIFGMDTMCLLKEALEMLNIPFKDLRLEPELNVSVKD